MLLDIDETIVHVRSTWLNRSPESTFRLGGQVYHIYFRPGLSSFLERLRSTYAIGVWTAATRDYAKCVLKRVFGPGWQRYLVCFLHRRHCTVNAHGEYVKDLSQFDRLVKGELPYTSVWLVDDNLVHKAHNAALGSNGVVSCIPFSGSHMDIELKRIWRRLGARQTSRSKTKGSVVCV